MKFVGDYFDMVKERRPDADYSNIVDLYLAVFHPYALGKSAGYVVGSERKDDYPTRAAKVNKPYIDRSMTVKDLERLPGRELGNVARRERGLPEIELPVITKRSIAKKVKRWKKTPMADSLDPKDFGAGDLPTSVKIAEDCDLLREVIRNSIMTYGLSNSASPAPGFGNMFKKGVDYKNASTNTPHAGQGYVDRSHPLPYEIIVRTNQSPRNLYDTLFGDDLETDYVNIIPNQVYYGADGFRLDAHVETGSNTGDEKDAKLIQDQIYKYVLSLPATPHDATFVISVKPVTNKIRY